MRSRKEFTILSFSTYEDAVEMESFCYDAGIPGRLIPLPPQIDAGCGLCWRMDPEAWEKSSERILMDGPGYEGCHTVCMWAMGGS